MKVFGDIKSIEAAFVAEPPTIQVTVGDAKWQYIECAPRIVSVITIAPNKPVSGFLGNLFLAKMYTGFPE